MAGTSPRSFFWLLVSLGLIVDKRAFFVNRRVADIHHILSAPGVLSLRRRKPSCALGEKSASRAEPSFFASESCPFGYDGYLLVVIGFAGRIFSEKTVAESERAWFRAEREERE